MTDIQENAFVKGETLTLDKPLNWTSFDVVNKLKWKLKKTLKLRKIKVGHAGTLDPLATGLLIICTGKNTKKIPELQGLEKEYTGIFTLGATTPSFDLETSINEKFPFEHITEDSICEVANAMVGTQEQVPPMFSAKKINGKRAYELAREGREVELRKNRIEIKEFEVTKIEMPEVHFRIVCSKGTYIRSIARDFGWALESGGYLSALRRTRIGSYRVKDALDVDKAIELIEASAS